MRRHRRRLSAALLAALAVASGRAAAQQQAQYDIRYGPYPQEVGDLYRPPPGSPDAHAAVLVIHGGGWIGGTRGANAQFSQLLAQKGFVVFNIDYRLGQKDQPQTHWPAQLADCQLAMRWLRSRAPALGADPNHIAAAGDSAGGTLAVLLGVTVRPVQDALAALLPGTSPRADAVIDQFGPLDLAALGHAADAINEGLFGTVTPSLEAMQEVSPLESITPAAPPMLVVHGAADSFVPIAQSQALVERLRSQGVATQLVTFNGGHAFKGLTGQQIGALARSEIDWLLGVWRR